MNKSLLLPFLITIYVPLIISCSDNKNINTQEIIEEPAMDVSIDITYEYDELNRVTKAIYSNGQTVVYSYDAAGNITKKIIDSSI